MKTVVMEVSPDTAKEWLQHNNSNRKLSEKLIKDYAYDMEHGNWTLTHQGLAFYENGDIADGQHRLHAVIKSNKIICFMVTFGISNESKPNIDRVRPRSNLDSIRIGGIGEWIGKDHISVINAMRDLTNNLNKASVHQIVNYGNQIKPHLITGCSFFTSKKRSITTAPVMSAVVLALISGADVHKIKRFCRVLNDGIAENNHEDITVIKLREFLMSFASGNSTRYTRLECHLKTQKVIQAFLSKQKLSLIRCPKEPIYVYHFTD